jgi:23S rRNA G2445 N2-methylase RlmL
MASSRLTLVGSPGTNKIMAGELSRLARRGLSGARLESPKKLGGGTLSYPFDLDVAHLAVWYHRTAARVLWDVMESRAPRLEPLYDDLLAQMAHQPAWMRDGASFSIRARNVGAFAAGERQIVGAVKNAIIDGAERRGVALRVDSEQPDVHVAVRMHDNVVTVGIDLAGGPMHKRGYRLDGGVAPLRETMAAALVMLARHDSRREPLLDPMAGSGTIAIEAALMARGEPVWVGPKRPALDALPAFGEHLDRPTPPLFADTEPTVIANEVDSAALASLRRNAKAAGVAQWIDVREGDFRDLRRGDLETGPGVILSNPPYGERLGYDDIVPLYEDLGQWLRGFGGWRAGFVVANPDFVDAVGLKPRIQKPLSAKPLKGYFYLYEL